MHTFFRLTFCLMVFISMASNAWAKADLLQLEKTQKSQEEFEKFCQMRLQQFQSKKNVKLPPEKAPVIVYSLDQMIEKMLTRSYAIKDRTEEVFQARQKIKTSIGRLLPSLNFGLMMGAMKMDHFDLAASLLGFIFPSNWFRVKESKLFFEAEKRSLAVLKANQINAMYSMYYNISYIKYLKMIYDDIIVEMQRFVEIAEKRAEFGEDKADVLLKVKNILLLLEQDRRDLHNDLEKSKFALAAFLGDAIEVWNDFDIEIAQLPNIHAAPTLNPDDFFEPVKNRSLEWQEMDYLILASKYSIRARAFDFFNPAGAPEATLGFGYINHLKVGKSQQIQLQLLRRTLGNRLILSVYQAVEDYNLAVSSYHKIEEGHERAQMLTRFLERQVTLGDDYDLNEFIEVIQAVLSYQSQLYALQVKALLSKAVLNRLLLEGKHYENLLQNLQHSSMATQSQLTLSNRYENYKIDKAIKKGKITLPVSSN